MALSGIATIVAPIAAHADWDAAEEARDAARRKAPQTRRKTNCRRGCGRAKAAAQAESNKRMADDYRKRYRDRSKGMVMSKCSPPGVSGMPSTAKAMRDTAEAIKHLPPEQRAMAEQMMKQAAAQQSSHSDAIQLFVAMPIAIGLRACFRPKSTKLANNRQKKGSDAA